MNRMALMRILSLFLALVACAGGQTGNRGDEMQKMLDEAGFGGGLVVMAGQEDPNLALELASNGNRYVLVLTEPEKVMKFREAALAAGKGNAVVVESFDGKRIPCADSMVNIFIQGGGPPIADKEVMRALRPLGSAFIKNGVGWEKVFKPWPKEMAEWPNFLGDAGNNAVAHDNHIAPPQHIQWQEGPQYARDHDALASLSAMVSARGKLFYIYDEGPISEVHKAANWQLIARDGFNGMLLWKRPMPDWMTHLRHFRTGPTFLPRKLVADGNRLFVSMGLTVPVSVLDAQTGKTLMEIKGSENTEEMICCDGQLFTVAGNPTITADNRFPKDYGDYFAAPSKILRTIKAFDVQTGALQWTQTNDSMSNYAPLSLAASGDKVVFLDGDFLNCVDRKTGRLAWKAPFETKKMGSFKAGYAPTVVLFEGVAGCVFYDKFCAFSMQDGKLLWQKKGYMGFGSPADLFGINGRFWSLVIEKGTGIERMTAWDGAKNIDKSLAQGEGIHSYDAQSGKELTDKKVNDIWKEGHHHRCYRNRATSQFLITGRDENAFFDVNSGECYRQFYLRGECQYGVLPCNGMVYFPPNPCDCFIERKLDGFNALTPAWENEKDMLYASQMEKGPAFGRKFEKVSFDKSQWPMYRGNPERSGVCEAVVPAAVRTAWVADVGGELTPPVAAGDDVVVARKDNNTVYMLSRSDGKVRWHFVAGGPVDTPPTFYNGRLLFGSTDGYLYCLDATDGTLAWRFAAAPGIQRIMVGGHLESSWPVHGSALVHDNVVYCTAGRSSFIDSGIWGYGLKVETGEPVCKVHLVAEESAESYMGLAPEIQQDIQSDILTLASGGLSMRGKIINFHLTRTGGNKSAGPTIACARGLVDDSCFHREPWKVGAMRGQLIVRRDNLTWGVNNPYTILKHTQEILPPNIKEGHQSYLRYGENDFPVGCWLECGSDEKLDKADLRKHAGWHPEHKEWREELPMLIRGMVLAGDRLFTVGTVDAVTAKEFEPNSKFQERTMLQAWDALKGTKESTIELQSPPVFDGLIAAGKRLYLSDRSGKVVCFGP